MRRSRLRGILLASAFLSASAWVVQAHGNGVELAVAEARVAPAYLYRDGPPPGFSGGFGEDHCQACHFGDTLNAKPGSLTISAPARYSPGRTYTLTLTLTRPGMVIGGFQLTARFEDGGAQAGTLAVTHGDRDRVKVTTDRGVQYAYHQRPGTGLTGRNVVRWTLRWTAPAGGGSVRFHVAANAANEDDSQFGDFVYTASVRSTVSPDRSP
jgi:hypothetical protein